MILEYDAIRQYSPSVRMQTSPFFTQSTLSIIQRKPPLCLCFSFPAYFYPLTSTLLCLWMTNILAAERATAAVVKGTLFNPITSQFGGTRNQIKCCFYPVCDCVCSPWHLCHRVTLWLCVWRMCVSWCLTNRRRRGGRVYCAICLSMKCWGALDDSSKVTEFLSPLFPLHSPPLLPLPECPSSFFSMAIAFSSSVASFAAFSEEQWCADWHDSCGGGLSSSLLLVILIVKGALMQEGQSSYNTLNGVNAVIVRSCDISFCLLEEPSILQFHGVNGTLDKLLFKNKGASAACRCLCPAGITLWRSVWCGIRWSVAFAVSK